MVSENVGKIYFICVFYLFHIYAYIHICLYMSHPTLMLDHAGTALY